MKKRRNATPVITVRRAPGARHRAILTFGPLSFRAAIGRSGMTVRKREGDGATPVAVMPILYGYARKPVPSSGLRIARIRADMGWCDAPASPCYNRPVRLPFRQSHERLMREDGIYDIVIVIDWNVTGRARNRGSAVFFHLARPDFSPTAGCIAISAQAMRLLLPHLRKGVRLAVRG